MLASGPLQPPPTDANEGQRGPAPVVGEGWQCDDVPSPVPILSQEAWPCTLIAPGKETAGGSRGREEGGGGKGGLSKSRAAERDKRQSPVCGVLIRGSLPPYDICLPDLVTAI